MFDCKRLLIIILCLYAWKTSAQETRKLLENPEPAYPALARQLSLSGVVRVEVTVGTDGRIKDAKVLGGHPILVDSALAAVRKWRYEKASSESKLLLEFRFHP
jgi:TonB family protein